MAQIAAGGGDFCKAVAASLNRPATAGTTPKEMSAQLVVIRRESTVAASLAPASLKADVNLLMAASFTVWDALAKVNYDYSQLKPTDMNALASPEVAAASKRLTAYMTGTCGLSVGAPAAASH